MIEQIISEFSFALFDHLNDLSQNDISIFFKNIFGHKSNLFTSTY